MIIRQPRPDSAPHQPYLPQQTLPLMTNLYQTLGAHMIYQSLPFPNQIRRGETRVERSHSAEGKPNQHLCLHPYLNLTWF